MRVAIAGAFLLGLASMGGTASAQTPPAPAPAQQYDVPTTAPQTVLIMTRDFAPGQAAGRHIHHGVEMSMVLKGDMELTVDGAAPHVYHAGESFIVPRDIPHDAKNVGTTTATLAITYVIDKGSPMRLPAP